MLDFDVTGGTFGGKHVRGEMFYAHPLLNASHNIHALETMNDLLLFRQVKHL